MFTLYADPGHAWLKVPRKMLHDMGIATIITTYSFERGDDVYLEEDCDLAVFMHHYREQFGKDPQIVEQYSNRSSRIRNYNSYVWEYLDIEP